MKCPGCSSELHEKVHKGIEVDFCSNCEGMWLDPEELDELEDTVFDDDDLKGTVIFSAQPSKKECPKCSKTMKEFRYRLYNLTIDFCADHGYWLDKGEEERVLELIQEEAGKMKRKFSLEGNWPQLLKSLKSKSFFSKLKKLKR